MMAHSSGSYFRKYNSPPKNNKRKFSKHEVDETEWMNKICSEKGTPDEQLPLIVVELEAGPFYYKQVQQIQFQLTKALNYFYRGQILKIEPFGSAITRLALKNSDVDIFLDFGDDLPDTPQNLARSLKNKIGKQKVFFRPIAIPARVPIVQCVHISGISCDISFLNGLGVSNSNLIRFLLSLDKRIRPLVLLLKYLFKKKGLVSSSGVTSYALTMLVVFFLQQLKQPLLPSISHMQELARFKESVSEWNTSFTTDPSLLPSITNQDSFTELLREFFKFYSTFEFGFYVISVFTGRTYLKNFFANSNLLPDEFSCYKENLKLKGEFECNKCMCVQGPFNHSHNITRNVPLKILQEFQSFCANNVEICSNLDQDKNQNSEYFLNLFKQISKETDCRKLKGNTYVALYFGDNIDLTNPSLSENEIRNQWVENILNSVTAILTKIMKCKINIYTKDNYKSCYTFIAKEEMLKLFECEMSHFELVTKKRNEAKQDFQFPTDMDLMKQEELISDYICDTILKDKSIDSYKFDVICTVNKNPTCFLMYLECTEKTKAGKNLVLQIFQFIKNSFPKWIK